MKKYRLFILCLLLLCVSLPCVNVTAADPITIKAGIYDNYPKLFIDDNGIASGFWPDILNYIAAEEGWNIEYIYGSWNECLQRLETGEIDMMPDIAFTGERAEKYDYSGETVYTSWSMVYVPEGAQIESVLDLEGKTVAVMQGSINVEGPTGIKQLTRAFDVNCTFVETSSYADVFKLVEQGKADAGVSSKDFGYQHYLEYGLQETPIIFQPSQLYFAFPKGAELNPYLIEKIDYYVKNMKEDRESFYYDLIIKWFLQVPAEKRVIPEWMIWILATIGGLAVLLGGGSFVMRRQVQRRTRDLTEEITRRKKADEELSKYREHLEQLVEERTAEIERKNQELEEANIRLQEMDRLKSVFLASMSHELRTPLNSIIGFTGILLMELAGPVNDEQKKQLSMVKNSASHLLNLINDVLDISKIEAGKVEISPEEFELKDIIKETADTFSVMASDKGLELVVEVPEGIRLFKDKRRFKQILMNLLSNAMKFTEHGSVKVLAEADEDKIIRLHVSDTGIGIKKDELGKLFQPFQQIDISLTKKYDGTGLGLYLTKKLVDILGGNISARSEYGKGTEFVINMPPGREEKGEN